MRPFRQSSTGFEHARVSTNTGQFISARVDDNGAKVSKENTVAE